jgi:putative membrane protein
MERSNRYRYLWVALIAAGLIGLALMPGHGMMWGGPGPGAGFGWFGFLLRSLFWVALIMLVIGFFRRRRDDYWDWREYRGEPRSSTDSSMEILKRRYAAGEISREQFEEMRGTLEANSA